MLRVGLSCIILRTSKPLLAHRGVFPEQSVSASDAKGSDQSAFRYSSRKRVSKAKLSLQCPQRESCVVLKQTRGKQLLLSKSSNARLSPNGSCLRAATHRKHVEFLRSEPDRWKNDKEGRDLLSKVVGLTPLYTAATPQIANKLRTMFAKASNGDTLDLSCLVSSGLCNKAENAATDLDGLLFERD